MESLGNKLRTARESKGYDLDSVSREINIAVKHLAALEAEDFSIFPGEPYIKGFLRNYGEFLGLDVEEVNSLYRALKIQEQPIPDDLLKTPSSLPKVLTGLGITAVAAGLIAGGWYFFSRRPPRRPPEPEVVRSPVVYEITTEPLETRFYRGDTILIPVEDNEYQLEFTSLGEIVTLSTPSGPVSLDLGQEITLDLDEDGFQEIYIRAGDFARNNPNAGVQLTIRRETPPPSAGSPEESTGRVPGTPSRTAQATGAAIFSSPNPYPFTVQASFQGYCLFRWEVLNDRNRQEQHEEYFQRSGEQSIPDIHNGVRLGVSNAAAVKLQIMGGGKVAPLELGGAGEVVAADVRWIRDDEGRFRLVMIRLD
jgi:cytoskeletal protein RodZ